jgi:hypothetical protein
MAPIIGCVRGEVTPREAGRGFCGDRNAVVRKEIESWVDILLMLPTMRHMSWLSEWQRPRGAAGAGVACLVGAAYVVLSGVPVASGARTAVPDPCQIVPKSLIAAAFGAKNAPPSTSTAVLNATTCSYKHGLLTISIGYTALTNPAAPLKTKKVAGLPHGLYETYSGTTQTAVTFINGTAATGLYGVVRNFGRIPEKKLEKIAKALSHGAGSATGGASGGTLVP